MRSRRSQVRIDNADDMAQQQGAQSQPLSRASAGQGRQASSLPFADLDRTSHPAAMSFPRAAAAEAGTPRPESLAPGPFLLRVAFLLILAFMIATSLSQAATYVGGPITTDVVWGLSGSPYIVQSDVVVASDSGATPALTIAAGVSVKFNSGTGLYIGSGSLPGKLYAVGTTTQKISFSANGSTQRGFHNGIFFDDGAENTSILQYATVYYGAGANPGNVTISACNVTVKNCTIRYSSNAGIYLQNGAKPVMSANSVAYCTGYPLSFDPSCRVASVTSITGSTSNGTNMVEVRPGDLTGSNETWRKLSLAYHVLDRVMVYGTATTATKLVISGGATLKFAEAGHLVIGSWLDPSLKATLYTVGSAANITRFTSAQATPAPGDWPGIIMLDGATDTLSSIQYATVEFGGRETNAGIWLYSCSPTIKNSVTVKNSLGTGIFMLDSASTITGVTLASNTAYGIKIEGDAARASKLSSLTFSGNGHDAVEYVRPEIREASETLPYLGTTSVYEFPNGLAVHGGNSTAAKLSIANGLTLRFLNGSSLSIGNDLPEEPAILVASGTASLPVIIEGSDPSPASWGAVYLNDSLLDASTTLDWVTARYGTTGFYLTNSSPTLRNCFASNGSSSGIILSGACAPVITGGASTDNAAYAIEVDGPSLMSGITGLSGSGNAQNLVRYVGRELKRTGDSLPNLGLAFQVEGSILVRGNAGESPLLRLAPGLELRFAEHERLIVGSSSDDAAGALEAIGTATSPILLRSQGTGWGGVYLDNTALDASTRLSFVTIAEGGQDDAALYIAGTKPTIDNLTIQGSQQFGIILWEAAPTITTATITGTASAPVLASANCRLKNLSGFVLDSGSFVSYGGGLITAESETLPAFSVPYRVTGLIEVWQDLTTAASLTLAPGVRMEFAPATGINVGSWADASQGILISAGTQSAPVILTGIDGATWDAVNFLDGSLDGATRLDFTTIDLAGASSNRAVYVGSSSPIFDRCSISRSASYGLFAQSAPSLQVTNSTFDSNANFPVSVDIMTSLAAFTGNILTGNQPADAVEHRGGDVTSDTRIGYAEQGYVLNGGIAIHGSLDSAATLFIEPGVVIKQNTTSGITVGLPTGEKGRIVADATEALPITFTTNLTPAPGAWHGFEFYTAAPASSVTHCVIEYAGQGNEKSVELIGGAATFANTTIRDGLGDGLVLRSAGASATLTDSSIEGFTRHGVDLQDSVSFVMTGGTIRECGTYGVQLGAVSPTLSGLTIASCGSAPLRATTSSRLKNIGTVTIDPSATVSYVGGRLQGGDEVFPGLTYQLTTGLEIANDTMTPTTLTLSAGATLRFPSGQKLIVGGTSGQLGSLLTQGMPAQPVILTGYTQSRGSWGGLELRDAAFDATTRLVQTTVQYGGSPAVLITAASPAFEDSRVTQSLGAAISASGSSATFLRCSIDANGGDGLSASGGGSITLDSTTLSSNTWGINSSTRLSVTGCTASSNTSGGIKLTGGSSTIAGSTVSSNPTGLYLSSSSAAVTNTSFTSNTAFPISLDAASSLEGSASLTFTANGKQSIEHRGGTVSTTQTLPELGLPYDVSADLSVVGPRGGATAILTLDAATTLRFATGKALQVANGASLDQRGALISLGTQVSPVTLRSQSEGQAGSWTGLTVWYEADPAALSLSYLRILDATTGLRVYASPTSITGLDIQNCSNYGLILGRYDAPASELVTVTSSSIIRNTGGGALFVGPAQITDSVISENTGNGVVQEADYASSTLERCTVASNGSSGLMMQHGTNTTRQCSIVNNGRIGIEIPAVADEAFKLSVQDCTISGNQQGGATIAVDLNHDLRQNYWGDASGPAGVGPGNGDSVGSTSLIYEPWREAPYDASFAIEEAAATNRVVPAQQSEASFWAQASGQADWTLEIRDQADTVHYTAARTSKQFYKRWDCLDQSALPLAPGTYKWRILATKTGSPETVAGPLAGTFQVSAAVPRAEIHTPTEHSQLGSFEVVASTAGQPQSWTLYGGPGDGRVPKLTSLQQLATGTGDISFDTMAAVDLTAQTEERYVCALVAVGASGTLEQRMTIIKSPFTVAPNPFSPNGDEVEDTTRFGGTFDAVSWTLTIRDSQGALQRTWTGTGGDISVTWDGKDEGAVTVADGDYDYVLELVDATAETETVTGSVVVLATAPIVELLSPVEGAIVTNLNGTPTVSVRGNIFVPTGRSVTWRAEVGAGAQPATWSTLATGQASATLTDYLFTTWAIDPSTYPNGPYQLRLDAVIIGGAEHYDQNGFQIANYLIEILSPSKAFNPRLGESAAIRIHAGLASDITVDAYRVADSTQSEQPVLAKRLAESLAVQPGTVDLTWDGQLTDGSLASDYIYAIQVTVSQGGSPLGSTGDTSRAFYDVMADGVGASNSPSSIEPAGSYRPFRQPPLRITYPVYVPALLGFRFMQLVWPMPRFDLYRGELQPTGTHVETWDATQSNELFVGANYVSIQANLTVNDGPTSYNNLIALYGNIPRIEGLSLDRPTFTADDFADASASAMLYYSLDQAADVTVELTSLATGAVIDTWSLPGQSAGAQEFSWNGTTRDGRWIDKGEYRWRITASANGFTSRSVYALMRVTH